MDFQPTPKNQTTIHHQDVFLLEKTQWQRKNQTDIWFRITDNDSKLMRRKPSAPNPNTPSSQGFTRRIFVSIGTAFGLYIPKPSPDNPNPNILSHKDFVRRMLVYTGIALGMVAISLGIGVVGYHYCADLEWLDSLYNASMILTGMGPVDKLETAGAKWFASFYALFSGVVFLSTVGIFFAPIAHRLMHVLHVDPEEDNEV